MRDFDQEAKTFGDRQYNYDFDDVVRGFALQAFEPFFKSGPTLELGCHEGGMTRLLVGRWPDLTVVDASEAALAVARQSLPPDVTFVHGTFEAVSLPPRFENILLINVLEHVDDPLIVLKRAQEWLTPTGKVFLIVPNANAPSRQIAVQMGLITHNQAVTDAERRNGHHRTYSLDTLGRDLRSAGMHVDQIGGLVFKGLANYQMDKALAAGIITADYLKGCYELGKVYPDLCASLFAVCSTGKVA